MNIKLEVTLGKNCQHISLSKKGTTTCLQGKFSLFFYLLTKNKFVTDFKGFGTFFSEAKFFVVSFRNNYIGIRAKNTLKLMCVLCIHKKINIGFKKVRNLSVPLKTTN